MYNGSILQSIARCSLISLLLLASRNRLTHYCIQKRCSGSWVLQFLVHCLQPFQVVEDPKFTKHIRYESLTQLSFKKYLKNWQKSLKRKFETYCQTYLHLFLMGGRPVIHTILLCTLRLQMTALLGYKSEIQNNLNYFLEIIHFGKLNGCGIIPLG